MNNQNKKPGDIVDFLTQTEKDLSQSKGVNQEFLNEEEVDPTPPTITETKRDIITVCCNVNSYDIDLAGLSIKNIQGRLETDLIDYFSDKEYDKMKVKVNGRVLKDKERYSYIAQKGDVVEFMDAHDEKGKTKAITIEDEEAEIKETSTAIQRLKSSANAVANTDEVSTINRKINACLSSIIEKKTKYEQKITDIIVDIKNDEKKKLWIMQQKWLPVFVKNFFASLAVSNPTIENQEQVVTKLRSQRENVLSLLQSSIILQFDFKEYQEKRCHKYTKKFLTAIVQARKSKNPSLVDNTLAELVGNPNTDKAKALAAKLDAELTPEELKLALIEKEKQVKIAMDQELATLNYYSKLNRIATLINNQMNWSKWEFENQIVPLIKQVGASKAYELAVKGLSDNKELFKSLFDISVSQNSMVLEVLRRADEIMITSPGNTVAINNLSDELDRQTKAILTFSDKKKKGEYGEGDLDETENDQNTEVEEDDDYDPNEPIKPFVIPPEEETTTGTSETVIEGTASEHKGEVEK